MAEYQPLKADQPSLYLAQESDAIPESTAGPFATPRIAGHRQDSKPIQKAQWQQELGKRTACLSAKGLEALVCRSVATAATIFAKNLTKVNYLSGWLQKSVLFPAGQFPGQDFVLCLK